MKGKVKMNMTNRILSAIALVSAVCGCASAPKIDHCHPRNGSLQTLDGPLIQAHRGSRAEFHDNAAGGFRWCIEKGVRGFETDLRFTKDHKLVIMHDDRTDRTTDGKGRVEELTYDELRNMTLRNCGEKVPTFQDVCEALGGRDDIFIELEMKARPGKFYTPEVLEEYCRRLHDEAARFLKPGTYAFTCFDATVLRTMRRIDPDAPLALIMFGQVKDKHWELARELRCSAIAPTLEAPAEQFAQARAEGFLTCTWMVHDAEDWRLARAKGATRVTTDYPHLLDMAVRGRKKDLILVERELLCDANGQVAPEDQKILDELGRRSTVKMIGGGKTPEDPFAAAKKLGFTPDQTVLVECPRPHRGMDRIAVRGRKNFAEQVRVLLKP